MQSNVFVGNLAKDPALTQSGGKKPFCRFTLIENRVGAVDEETGERKEYSTALPLVAFGHLAETIAKHCLKGDQLIVTHEVRNDNYEKDGEDRYGFNFIATSLQFGAPGPAKRKQFENGESN